ncbi:hypothetical protein VTK56DRAFT_585 [Thermocarpiscus australiensis]
MRRTGKSAPRVYHDGLIPTEDPFKNLPEVVPSDHVPIKHEKSYPEVAPPPPVIAPAVLSLPGPAPAPIHTPPPRNSAAHSLRQVWSDFDGQQDDLPPEDRVPLWKRPIVWVIAIALAIIIVLAGILAGVATGRINTAFDDASTQPSSTTNPTCPSANNLNYTTSTTTSPRQQKTFRVRCDANYPGGDGTLGLQPQQQQNATGAPPIDSLAACLDACARHADCVGAVFRPGPPGNECWLKQFLGVIQTGEAARGMESGVLWQ